MKEENITNFLAIVVGMSIGGIFVAFTFWLLSATLAPCF